MGEGEVFHPFVKSVSTEQVKLLQKERGWEVMGYSEESGCRA